MLVASSRLIAYTFVGESLPIEDATFPQYCVVASVSVCLLQALSAQDLAPRAYVITAVNSNAVTLTWSFSLTVALPPALLPISGATGTYSVPIFSYYHSFASLAVRPTSSPRCLTHSVTSRGPYSGAERQSLPLRAARFGFWDSVNLKGRSGNARTEVREMEAEGAVGSKSKGDGSDWSVRSD